MKTKKKVVLILSCTLVLSVVVIPVFAYFTANYWWSENFHTVYAGYNTNHKNTIRLAQRIVALYPGCPGISDDGIFGANTTNAVSTYQALRGLTNDGKVGPATWANMQLRATYAHGGTLYEYYKIKNTTSDAASSPTYDWEAIRHTSTGQWAYRMYLSDSWGSVYP